MNHTNKAKLKVQSLLAPVDVTGSGTSSSVDLQNYNGVSFHVHAGDFAFDGTNKITLTLGESDDGTTFTVVAEADMIDPESGTIAKILDAAGDKNATHPIHYKGNKRYVQVVFTEGGTVDVPLAISAVLAYPEFMPPL